MTNIENFVVHVGGRVGSSDDLSIYAAVQQACIIFMQDTQIFLNRSRFYGQAGHREYILEVPEHMTVLDIEPDGVTLNGRVFHSYLRDGQYDVIKLTTTPVDGGCYEVEYSYSILPDACEVPDELYSKYLNAIVDKAITLLYTGDKNTMVSQHLYQIAQASYKNTLDDIRVRKFHNFSNRPMRMTRKLRSGYVPW